MLKPILKNHLVCQKKEHQQWKIQFFEFSENAEDMLQCLQCTQQKKSKKRIVLDQILQNPLHQIRNFPPIEDEDKAKKIRKVIEIYDKEYIEKEKNQTLNQIEETYLETIEKITNALLAEKKMQIDAFTKMYQQIQVQKSYDLDQLKQALEAFSEDKIDLNELHKIQLELKKDYQSPQKADMILIQQTIADQIKKEAESVSKELETKLKLVSKDIVASIVPVQELLLEKTLATISETSLPEQKQEEVQQQKSQPQSQPSLEFFKSTSNSQSFDLNEITITNNKKIENSQIKDEDDDRNKNFITKVSFDCETDKNVKQVYSSPLDKTKKHSLKLRFNFNNCNHQRILFSLIDKQKQNYGYYRQSDDTKQGIFLSNSSGDCFAIPVNENTQKGLNFSNYMIDNDTIFNIIIDYQKDTFEIYDDENKGYVKLKTNKDFIPGSEEMFLGIYIYQFQKKRADFEIIEYKIE